MSLVELLTAPDPHRPVVTAEFPAVDGGGLEAVAAHAARLAPYVDAVNVTDNPAAHAHASNVAVAIAVRRLGLEPVLQVACRDKNRLAVQADIAGAALHGITTVCCMTGDDTTAGDEPEARRVFDLDGPQLVRTAAVMAGGSYLSGRALTPAPPLFIGAVENPGAPPFHERAVRALKKVEAGARFLQLQICYRPERLSAFCERAEAGGVTPAAALLPTIALVKGARALRFMDTRVPGISIPQDVIERVEKAPDEREASYEVSLELARTALAQPGVRGIHITDFRHDEALGRLCSDLGLPTMRSAAGEDAVAV